MARKVLGAAASGATDVATLGDVTSRAVRYDAGQSLTAAQMIQALANEGVVMQSTAPTYPAAVVWIDTS